ncbi:class I SAM-dependent methyltransferase [Pseudohalioglobus lutimaris]|uniref:Class I SAM-dependent methyltransferase n=1 Tax=Pseudohalioglobus lutimaris TaxID=1737061 RepID=A0A2N5X266_9GAMM|nr:class I SAM-dependent methyltransferase [Pseudohalioglobus lutimaris]PLW68576.1 class I SAM-dependent methyltransferase [Pseudohalioglobus lutimaris]
MANEQQHEYWNGEAGARWAAEDETMATLLRPVAQDLLAHLQPEPGSYAVDIGCGGGSQSVLLAESIGAGGEVLGVDISAPMLEIARGRDLPANAAALSFLETDAATYAFDPGSVDLLFSRFGVMFFDDPVAAFSNMRYALKDDGRLGFCCWQAMKDNQWTLLPVQAALRHIAPPESPDPHAPGPFALADPQRLESILAASGFGDIVIAPHAVNMNFGSGGGLRETVAELMAVGPVSRLLVDQPAETIARVVDEGAQVMEPFYTDGKLKLAGAVWFVTANAA